jgi:hypothetical protein
MIKTLFFCFLIITTACQEKTEAVKNDKEEGNKNISTPLFFKNLKKKSKLLNIENFSLKNINRSKPDSGFVKMSKDEFIRLDLAKKYEFNNLMGGNYYYAFGETNELFLITLLLFKDPWSYCLDLLTYDKKGNFIDAYEVAITGGDGGWIWEKKSNLVNDSILNLNYQLNYLSTPNFTNVCEEYNLQLELQKNGKFKALKKIQITKKSNEDCQKAGENNFKKNKQK